MQTLLHTIDTAKISDAQHKVLDFINKNHCAISECAKILGMQASSASAKIKSALDRVGLPALLAQYPGATEALLMCDAKRKGKSAPGIVEREQPALIAQQDLLNATQDKLCLVLSYIDRHNISRAKLSELTGLIKALFDVSQVMQGKPTSISHSESVRALKDLVPALMTEAQRRGIVTVEGEVVEVRDPAPEPAWRRKPRGTRSKRIASTDPDVLGVQDEALGVTPPGPLADGVGASVSVPVNPTPLSDFSKLIEDL